MVTSSTSDIAKTEGATPSSIAQVTGKLEIPPVPPIAPTQSASAPAPIPPTQAETTADAIGGLPKASAQIIAVRPAGNVLPLLQGLLSEYVFTQAKSAKGVRFLPLLHLFNQSSRCIPESSPHALLTASAFSKLTAHPFHRPNPLVQTHSQLYPHPPSASPPSLSPRPSLPCPPSLSSCIPPTTKPASSSSKRNGAGYPTNNWLGPC